MRKFGWVLVSLGAVVGLTGCGIGPLSSAPKPHPRVIKPAYTVATPSATLSETAPTPQGITWVLAGNAKSKGLYEVSLADRKVVGSFSVTGDATAVAMSPTGQLALGAGYGTDGYVEFLSAQTGIVSETVPVGGAIKSLSASSDGSVFYALDATQKSASVTVINAQTGQVEGTLPVALDAVSAVGTPDDSGVYYLEPNGDVSEVSTAGGQLQTTFPVGHGGLSLAMSVDGQTLYVLKTRGGVDNIAVVDLATESVLRALPAAAHSLEIALSPDGQTLYDLVGTPAYGNIQALHIPS